MTQPSWRRGPLAYEGKAKKIYEIENEPDLMLMEFKDSLTAFNALKKGSFVGKGAINRDIASAVFAILRENDIASHWVADLDSDKMVVEKLQMIPLEVVVRNRFAGSLAKRFGRAEGDVLPQPVVEIYYKNDALEDPFINDDHVRVLEIAEPKELEEMKLLGQKINTLLLSLFSSCGLLLVDFKLEFGRRATGQIVLGDEITPDSCRLWDEKTGEKKDKDRFRRDLGLVEESYQDVLQRLKAQKGATI